MKHNKLEVKNYGDLLSKILDMDLVNYVEVGSYQGEYIAILKDDKYVYIYSGSFGSCSGCDWLESYSLDYQVDPYIIDYKEGLDYAKQSIINLKMPKNSYLNLSDTSIKNMIIETFDSYCTDELEESIENIYVKWEEKGDDYEN